MSVHDMEYDEILKNDKNNNSRPKSIYDLSYFEF